MDYLLYIFDNNIKENARVYPDNLLRLKCFEYDIILNSLGNTKIYHEGFRKTQHFPKYTTASKYTPKELTQLLLVLLKSCSDEYKRRFGFEHQCINSFSLCSEEELSFIGRVEDFTSVIKSNWALQCLLGRKLTTKTIPSVIEEARIFFNSTYGDKLPMFTNCKRPEWCPYAEEPLTGIQIPERDSSVSWVEVSSGTINRPTNPTWISGFGIPNMGGSFS